MKIKNYGDFEIIPLSVDGAETTNGKSYLKMLLKLDNVRRVEDTYFIGDFKDKTKKEIKFTQSFYPWDSFEEFWVIRNYDTDRLVTDGRQIPLNFSNELSALQWIDKNGKHESMKPASFEMIFNPYERLQIARLILKITELPKRDQR